MIMMILLYQGYHSNIMIDVMVTMTIVIILIMKISIIMKMIIKIWKKNNTVNTSDTRTKNDAGDTNDQKDNDN